MKTSHKKRIIFLIVILALIAITRLTDLDRYLTFENLQENKFRLQQIVQGNYVLSVGGYIVTYIVVVAFSIPGAAILTLTGGVLFGVLWGAIYVNAGATTGAALAFLFCRYVAGEWVQNKYQDKLKTFNKALSKNGYRYLLALRFIPVFPFFLINIFAGLTKIPLRTFIWTTSIGIFPGSLVYAFAGKQLGDIQSVEDIFSARIAVAFSLLALLVLFPVIVNFLKEGLNMHTTESSTSANKDAERTLLFVYNADTGLFSVVTDYAHKILSPKTYPCNLCAITYGNMGMNKKWKEFIAHLTVPVEFLHRDEYLKRFESKETQLPAAFIKRGESISMLITHSEINECRSIEDLMNLVAKKTENV